MQGTGISYSEYLVLKYLKENGEKSEYEIIIDGLDQRNISSAISYLIAKNLIKSTERKKTTYIVTDEAMGYLKDGFPEEKLYKYLKNAGRAKLSDIKTMFKDCFGIALSNLAKYGIKPVNGELIYRDTRLLDYVEDLKKGINEIISGSVPDAGIIDFLKKRNLIREKTNIDRIISINENGLKVLSGYTGNQYSGQLTSEMITSGSYKNIVFRPYDLNMRPEEASGGGLHPLTQLIRNIRRIFTEMGFTEMHGHFIEYTAWNMDMLFIPQDHPARDLQDTFYLDSDRLPEFENPEIIDLVKNVHENGYKSYSGWNYKWSEEEGKKIIMRTHTTVNTIRYLYNNRNPPQYIFSIEKVFRHESVDWKHLSELYQIEGAVYARDANLSTLKWLLREFYSRLGFNKIRLIPSYYPYTEPSMDVVVEINGKEVELGGSGIFRPEVTGPIGLKYPVLAFGLGLERLAMIYYGLTDIRDIYNSDIEWLKNYKIRLY